MAYHVSAWFNYERGRHGRDKEAKGTELRK